MSVLISPLCSLYSFYLGDFFFYPFPDFNTTVLVCHGGHNKVCQTGQLKQQKFLFSQLWTQEVEIKMLEGLVSSEAFLLGLQRAIFSLCLHLVFPLRMCAL